VQDNPMNTDGLLLALAYPDHFVKKTEGRYNTFLDWIGIVNNGMVRAGHSAVALISKSTGEVKYADFGRYITPDGMGRTRTALTDPDVYVPLKAVFDEKGNWTNRDEVLTFFATHPELTHGNGRCYIGEHNVDYSKAWKYIKDTNLKGSINYGPFVPGGNNCSRFTWNALRESTPSKWLRWYLIYRFFPSIMPLDLVVVAPEGNRYEVSETSIKQCSFGQWDIWLRLFEKFEAPEPQLIPREKFDHENGNWLQGIGDDGLFIINEHTSDSLLIERKDVNRRTVFECRFERPQEFDPTQPFEFVYDCNALYCTILQNERQFRVQTIDDAISPMKSPSPKKTVQTVYST